MNAKKSLSQKIARVFEIVNYILLIPTTFIELFVLFYGVIMIFAGGFVMLLFIIPIALIYCFGGLLLYGYYKHWRGEIDHVYAVWLWIGTILFNGFPLAMMLYDLIKNNFSVNGNEFVFYNIFGAYQIIFLLAVVALIDDLRREFD